MTYPVSTVPAVKAWLFAQMESTLTAAADGTFTLDYATTVDTIDSPDDQVWLGAVTNRVAAPFAMVGNMGAYALQEEYDLEVRVSCYRAGEEGTSATTDPAGIAEARAWALAGQIETIVRTDPTAGGAVVTSRPAQASCEVDWDENGNGRIADLTLAIHYFATI